MHTFLADLDVIETDLELLVVDIVGASLDDLLRPALRKVHAQRQVGAPRSADARLSPLLRVELHYGALQLLGPLRVALSPECLLFGCRQAEEVWSWPAPEHTTQGHMLGVARVAFVLVLSLVRDLAAHQVHGEAALAANWVGELWELRGQDDRARSRLLLRVKL